MRDRMGMYRDARKLRAPTYMIRRLGQQPPRRPGDLGQDELGGGGPQPVFPPTSGEIFARVTDPAAVPREAVGEGAAAGDSPGSMSADAGTNSIGDNPDDLVMDIDWVSFWVGGSCLLGLWLLTGGSLNGINCSRRRLILGNSTCRSGLIRRPECLTYLVLSSLDTVSTSFG